MNLEYAMIEDIFDLIIIETDPWPVHWDLETKERFLDLLIDYYATRDEFDKVDYLQVIRDEIIERENENNPEN